MTGPTWATFESDEFRLRFDVGDILEVTAKDGCHITVKRVYTEPKPVEDEPPALGVSVGEKVGTKERLG